MGDHHHHSSLSYFCMTLGIEWLSINKSISCGIVQLLQFSTPTFWDLDKTLFFKTLRERWAFPHFSYVNYGAIGSIIGHELTHGFDSKGRTYGALGNIRSWWTEESAREYTKRSQCLIDQYSRYNFTSEDKIPQINGDRTFSENLADNGGLKIAYSVSYAYREISRYDRHFQALLAQ